MSRDSRSFWLKSAKRRPSHECHHRNNHTRYSLLHGDGGEEELRPILQEPFLEKLLEPGDTLSSLALQFNCPVSELKRINHILRDNEIFARRHVRIPVRCGPLLAAAVHGVCTGGNREGDGEEQERTHAPSPSAPAPATPSPSPSLVSTVCELSDSEGDPPTPTVYTCSGVDGGLAWPQLLLCSLLLGFAGPILYVYVYVYVYGMRRDGQRPA